MHTNLSGHNICDKTPSVNLKVVYYTEVKEPPYDSIFADHEKDNFLGLILCTSKEGKIVINRKEYHLKKEQFILCNYQDVSELKSNENWKFFFFWFYCDNLNLPLNRIFDYPTPSSDLTICHKIISLLHYKDELCFLQANSLFADMLVRWLNHILSTTDDPYKKEMDDCVQFIHENLDTPLTIRSVAKRYHISEKHFRFLFEKYMTMRPKEYIHVAKLEKAKHLLLFSESSVTEIAYILCFSSASHLSTCFKAHYGLTPIEYRHLQSKKDEEMKK